MSDGRRARGEATRERVLAVARELFGRDGYEATSIDDVLAASGVTRGALYHHFSSKAELFEAVVDSALADVAEQTAAAARRATSTLGRLRAGCHAWLELALDPRIQRLTLVDPPNALGWTRWRELDEERSLAGLRAALDQLAEEGRLPRAEAPLLANIVLAALNEAALFITYASDQAAALGMGRSAIDTLLDRLAGVGPEQAA